MFVHMNDRKYYGGFRKLIAWQEARNLTKMIYKYTQSFPPEERYGLTDQLRRSASSTDGQIAEGSRMPTKKHRKSNYDRAYASTAEVDCFLELALDLKFLPPATYKDLLQKVNAVSYLTHKLSQSCL